MDHLSNDSIERLAALILVIGGAIFIALSLRTRLVRAGSAGKSRHLRSDSAGTSGRRPAASASVGRSLVLIMVGLSGGAAVIHLAAAPHHYAEIGDLASGFVLAAVFQAAWIRWCLAGPSRRTVIVGIVGNLAIVAAWAWTRTIGLPVGELAGTPEPVGYPDATSVVFELMLVAALVVRARRIDIVLSRRAPVRTLASNAVVPVIGLVLVLTSLATVALASGLDRGDPASMPMAGHSMTQHMATP